MTLDLGNVVKSLLFAALSALVACGPSSRRPGEGGGGGGGGGVDAPFTCSAGATENSAATCSDGQDNDCDGLVDCSDPDCSGIGSCPVCGMVQHPLGQPLELPDGVSGGTCTTDADCPATAPKCFAIPGSGSECRAPYVSKVHFDEFAQGQTLTDFHGIQSVCVNMEHSWLRDLEIQLVSPSGQMIELQKMEGRDGGEIFLGVPNDDDSGNGQLDDGEGTDPPPTPGTGWDYCWTPVSSKPDMLSYVDSTAGMYTSQYTLPADSYSASGQWSSLVGSTLNGDWEIVVADLWGIDNGFIFQWSIAFDPSLVQDCSTPPIQ